MNSLALRCCLVVSGLLLAGPAAADEPRYGVCRQQMTDQVRQRFGHTVTRIDVRTYASRSTMFDPGDALVYVEECSGFHAFDVLGTETVCEDIPHYGESEGSYVLYQGSYEGCGTAR